MASADVPSTKKKLQDLMETSMEALTRMRDQGIELTKLHEKPAASREERYLLRGVPVEDFRELQRVFVPKATDVFVVSFPKSGTTWVQHIVSLIKNNGVDDGQDLDDKWLWFELFSAAEVEQYSASCEGARLFKSHLPCTLMPGLTANSPTKYIYVYRNPKDVAVSYYYHSQAIRGPIPWDNYFDMFIKGETNLGSIFEHHTEWWGHKGMQYININFVSYSLYLSQMIQMYYLCVMKK